MMYQATGATSATFADTYILNMKTITEIPDKKFVVQPGQAQYATLSISRLQDFHVDKMMVKLVLQDGRVVCGRLPLESFMQALTGDKVLCEILKDHPGQEGRYVPCSTKDE